jgi:hypothetical protein
MKEYDNADEKSMNIPVDIAMHLKVPHSGNPNIDKMIRERNRRDLAKRIMDVFDTGQYCAVSIEGEAVIANWAWDLADAMIAEGKKEVKE